MFVHQAKLSAQINPGCESGLNKLKMAELSEHIVTDSKRIR